MTHIQRVHQAALHMRELAHDSVIPAYIAKMVLAADVLEQRAAELERQRSADIDYSGR